MILAYGGTPSIYLRRKERRTVRDDRRDVLPACVLKVQYNNVISAT